MFDLKQPLVWQIWKNRGIETYQKFMDSIQHGEKVDVRLFHTNALELISRWPWWIIFPIVFFYFFSTFIFFLFFFSKIQK
jgi:hypothetical protein